MNIQGINDFNKSNRIQSKKPSDETIKTPTDSFSSSANRAARIYGGGLFEASCETESGEWYMFKGSYAEDSTDENPKIKIKYHLNGETEEHVKYIYPKKINPMNATVEEYYALNAYLKNKGTTSGLEKPSTTGIYYKNNKRYDFISLLNRDIDMYMANGAHNQAIHYKKILAGLTEYISTDDFKSNVCTVETGINAEQALKISRAEHGFLKQNNALENMIANMKSRNDDMLLKIGSSNKNTQSKRYMEREKLEKHFEKLRYERKLTQESIRKLQLSRKDNLQKMIRTNLLKSTPYDWS